MPRVCSRIYIHTHTVGVSVNIDPYTGDALPQPSPLTALSCSARTRHEPLAKRLEGTFLP